VFHRVDFNQVPENARQTINQWVEQQTEHKIQNLLQPGTVTPDTRLILTNAIYFKADWKTRFKEEQTKEEDFHLTPTETLRAPLMHLEGGLRYFNGGTFQVLEIPYADEEMSMIVFLPNDLGGLPAFEQSLTASRLQQWLDGLQLNSKVILTLPKFEATKELELRSALGALGVKQAFDMRMADFSAMTGERNLWISAVIHKAYISVTEEGTVAAAATGIRMTLAMARPQGPDKPIVFRADHPFLYLIRDNRSQAILFMGRVVDPTK
jgi:serpin B